MRLRLPSRFKPTHQTAGLPGFPAIDVFGAVGSLVEAGSYGVVDRVSGRAISGNELPGGPYGFSVYWTNRVSGVRRYATHMQCLAVDVGTGLGPKTVLGQVAASPRGSASGSDHVHLGCTKP